MTGTAVGITGAPAVTAGESILTVDITVAKLFTEGSSLDATLPGHTRTTEVIVLTGSIVLLNLIFPIFFEIVLVRMLRPEGGHLP